MSACVDSLRHNKHAYCSLAPLHAQVAAGSITSSSSSASGPLESAGSERVGNVQQTVRFFEDSIREVFESVVETVSFEDDIWRAFYESHGHSFRRFSS